MIDPRMTVITAMSPFRPCWDQSPDDFGRCLLFVNGMRQNLCASILLQSDLRWRSRTNPPMERSPRSPPFII